MSIFNLLYKIFITKLSCLCYKVFTSTKRATAPVATGLDVEAKLTSHISKWDDQYNQLNTKLCSLYNVEEGGVKDMEAVKKFITENCRKQYLLNLIKQYTIFTKEIDSLNLTGNLKVHYDAIRVQQLNSLKILYEQLNVIKNAYYAEQKIRFACDLDMQKVFFEILKEYPNMKFMGEDLRQIEFRMRCNSWNVLYMKINKAMQSYNKANVKKPNDKLLLRRLENLEKTSLIKLMVEEKSIRILVQEYPELLERESMYKQLMDDIKYRGTETAKVHFVITQSTQRLQNKQQETLKSVCEGREKIEPKLPFTDNNGFVYADANPDNIIEYIMSLFIC